MPKSRYAVLATGLAFAASATSHHNTANFDFGDFDAIRGTVKLLDLRNPHSLLILEVENEQGLVKEKKIDGHSVNIILRSGLRHNMVHPGDQVTIYYAPSRTDDAMFMRAIQLPDGRMLNAGGVTRLSENELLELADRFKTEPE